MFFLSVLKIDTRCCSGEQALVPLKRSHSLYNLLEPPGNEPSGSEKKSQLIPHERTFELVMQGSNMMGGIIGEPRAARSLVECGAHCMRILDCNFFRYESMNKLCTLYGQGPELISIGEDREWYSLPEACAMGGMGK